MASTLSVEECATLPTEDVQQVAQADFTTLINAAMAEATRPDMRDTTRAWLCSPEQVELWLDALRWTAASLQASIEWKTYENDPRRRGTAAFQKKVRARLDLATKMYSRMKQQAYEDSESFRNEIDPDWRARRWLSQYFNDEATDLRSRLAAERGIPPTNPNARRAENWGDYLQHAHANGLIQVSDNAEVEDLLSLPDREFDRLVRADTVEIEDPDPRLRHPLVLFRWEEALRRLAEQTEAGDTQGMSLTPLAPGSLTEMQHAEVRDLVGRRRRFLGYAQRLAEVKMLRQPLLATVRIRSEERARPWVQLVEDVRDELIALHPGEYAFMRNKIAGVLEGLSLEAGKPQKIPNREAGRLRTEIFTELDARRECDEGNPLRERP